MAITSVPIRVNEDLRPSRLVKSIPSYIRRSIITIVRIFAVYRPSRFFGAISIALFGVGFLLGLRFLWKYLGYRKSVVLGKSVSVRVDLGGGLIVKKKHCKQYN